MCTRSHLETPSPSLSSFKEIQISDGPEVGDPSLIPEPSQILEMEYSPNVLEQSIEPESSATSENYETYMPSPEASFIPTPHEVGESEPLVTDNTQLIVNPFKVFTWKGTPRSSLKHVMRTMLDSSTREQELFYDDDKEDMENDESDSNSLVSDDRVKDNVEAILQASPKIIRVGEPSVVKLSLKLEGKDPIDGLESFRAYHLSSKMHNRTGLSVDLADDGTAIYFDDISQDNVFTGIFAMASDELHEEISFEIVPVIDGFENTSHPLSFKTTALSSYGTRNPSADAIGGGMLQSPRMSIVENLKNLRLKVHFIQSTDSKLASGAEFMHDVVGVDCKEDGNSNELMQFTDEGNVQTVIIDLDSAVEKGLLEDSVSVQLRAAYRQIESRTPIALVSVLENKATKREISRTRLSVPVILGVERGCPEAVVAKLSIFVGEQTAIVLKGTSMRKFAPAGFQ
ncbi:hypothetical protein FGB62_2g125 [Gracilaria domingensis]|nr:hypothetical protein FGB62_2g125 [Gracilaria domingensis]